MVLITTVTGAYKPTYNWGASHCTHTMALLWWIQMYVRWHLKSGERSSLIPHVLASCFPLPQKGYSGYRGKKQAVKEPATVNPVNNFSLDITLLCQESGSYQAWRKNGGVNQHTSDSTGIFLWFSHHKLDQQGKNKQKPPGNCHFPNGATRDVTPWGQPSPQSPQSPSEGFGSPLAAEFGGLPRWWDRWELSSLFAGQIKWDQITITPDLISYIFIYHIRDLRGFTGGHVDQEHDFSKHLVPWSAQFSDKPCSEIWRFVRCWNHHPVHMFFYFFGSDTLWWTNITLEKHHFQWENPL